MLNVYLLRHGETAMNADGNRYCGRTDIELTEKGLLQAETASRQLENIPIDAVYSSTLIRASKTAKIAGGTKTVIEDERLIEVDFGKWETKTREEFIAEDPVIWDEWCTDPSNVRAGGTGETAMEVVKRVDSFFEEVREKYPTGNIIVVGHNGINRLYLAWKLSMELKNYRRLLQENSVVTLFSLDENNEILLKQLNCKQC